MKEPEETPPITTYVLAGHEHNEAFKGAVDAYQDQPNVVVLTADDYPSLNVALEQIKPPANLVIASHGLPEGGFKWKNNRDIPSYKEVFEKLPAGIGIVTVISCFGETAVDASALRALPAGTILQSTVGHQNLSLGWGNTVFAQESGQLTDPTALILEALDNVNPKEYAITQTVVNAQFGGNPPHTLDPNGALPGSIGIGGKLPFIIHFSHLARDLTQASQEHPDHFNQAVELVTKHFDAHDMNTTNYFVTLKELVPDLSPNEYHPKLTKNGREQIISALKEHFPDEADKITPRTVKRYLTQLAAERADAGTEAMPDKIMGVVEKIKNNEPIATNADGTPDFDELRIRRAIGVAYLKTSGELDKLVEEAKQRPEFVEPTQPAPNAPQPEPPAPDKTAIPEFSSILEKHGLSREDFPKTIRADAPHPAEAPQAPAYAAALPQHDLGGRAV